MRQRARTPLALLAMLLVIVGAGLITLPSHTPAFAQTPVTQLHVQRSHDPDQDKQHDSDRDSDRTASGAANQKVTYGGGPVMAGTTHIYAIFWEPTGKVAPNYNHLILRFFDDVGSSSLYRLASQYKQANGRSPVNAVLTGAWIDTRSYPQLPLLDSTIQNEITHAQHVQGWHSSMQNVFFVFTQAGANMCMDSSHAQCVTNAFCAYHSAFGTDTLYAGMPYDASFACNPNSSPNHNDADQTIDAASHELMESVTDPLGNGWLDADGNEIGDKCVDHFGPRDHLRADVIWNGHPYLVQKEWDNLTRTCRMFPRP